jgi:hypothetical protein
MKSFIFYGGLYRRVEERVKEFINSHDEFLSSATIQSPRAVGDAIELLVRNEFESIAKIAERISFFENVRDFWLAMPDD